MPIQVYKLPLTLTHPHFRPVITLLLIARSLRLDFPFDLSLELIFIDGNINMNLCILNIRRNMIIQFLLTFSLSLRHSLSLSDTHFLELYIDYWDIYQYICISTFISYLEKVGFLAIG